MSEQGSIVSRLRNGVVRLRDWHESTDDHLTEIIMDDAADEIEHLQAENERLLAALIGREDGRAENEKLKAEIKQLRELLQEICDTASARQRGYQ